MGTAILSFISAVIKMGVICKLRSEIDCNLMLVLLVQDITK